MFTATKDDNVSNLKSGAKNFRDKADDVKSDLYAAKADAKEAVNGAKDNLTDMANEAGTKVRHFIHDASDRINHAQERVTSEIRTNPVQSSVIALGIGFVLGALFRR